MLPNYKRYRIYPSVVPADKETEITVVPTERAFLFFEGQEYTVKIIPVAADVPNRMDRSHHTLMQVIAHGGVLQFSYTFCDEQEYTVVVFNKDEKRLAALALYSLKEDLYERVPLRGDLHLHSYRSDGQQDPAALMGHFREQGYDFMALTDHNRYYPGGEIDEGFAGVKLGITHVQGEEIHIPEMSIHIVGVGSREAVSEIYIENSPEYQAEMAEYKASVPAHVPTQYADRYAMCKWVSDNVRKRGGLVIFPHPFWIPGDSKSFNVCDGLSALMMEDGLFDAYELIGGMDQWYNNRSVAFWSDMRMSGTDISVVGSSDVHEITRSVEFPHKFTVCFASDNSERDILEAVEKGFSVAVEAEGTEYERTYRAYGSLRLVSYAIFLLNNYFPELQRVCQGEGIAMRNYLMGITSSEVIELQVAQTEEFKSRYFGRLAPVLPSAEILDFEEKWRARHLKSPKTKGSRLDSNTVTRQI